MNEIVQINKLKTEIIKLSEELPETMKSEPQRNIFKLTKKEKDICRMKKNRNYPNYN